MKHEPRAKIKHEPRAKIKHESSSDDASSNTDITIFDATDASTAKAELLRYFGSVHTNGRVRCINSRAIYVYCKCAACGATAAAAKLNATQWSLTSMSAIARLPCQPSLTSMSAIARLPCTGSDSRFPVPPPSPPPPLSVESPPTSQCCICNDDFQRHVLFECPNPAAHLMCQDCFELNLSSQFGGDIRAFINRNCAIICTFCSCEGVIDGIPFNMQALVPR